MIPRMEMRIEAVFVLTKIAICTPNQVTSCTFWIKLTKILLT